MLRFVGNKAVDLAGFLLAAGLIGLLANRDRVTFDEAVVMSGIGISLWLFGFLLVLIAERRDEEDEEADAAAEAEGEEELADDRTDNDAVEED